MVSLRLKLIGATLVQAGMLAAIGWIGAAQVERARLLAADRGAVVQTRAVAMRVVIDIGRLRQGEPVEATVVASLDDMAQSWRSAVRSAGTPLPCLDRFAGQVRSMLPARAERQKAQTAADGAFAPLLARLSTLDQVVANADDEDGVEALAEARRHLARQQNAFLRHGAAAGTPDGAQATLALTIAGDELQKLLTALAGGGSEDETALASAEHRTLAAGAAEAAIALRRAIDRCVDLCQRGATAHLDCLALADELDRELLARAAVADAQAESEAVADMDRQRWMLGGCAALTLGLLWFLLRQVVQPIASMARMLAELGAGECDLSRRLGVRSRDEVGDFARGFDDFVGKIQGTVDTLATGVVELNGSTQSLDALATELRTQADDTCGCANRLGVAADQVVDSVGGAAASTGHLRSAGSSVRDSSERVRARTAEATTNVAAADEVVRSLAEKAREITKVTGIIADLSRQTNLLALNAAIEAARAGSAGASFAVVADEVRNLATRTAQQAAVIGKALTEVHHASTRSAEAMGAVRSLVDEVHTLQEAIAGDVARQHEAAALVDRRVADAATGSGTIRETCPAVAAGTARTRELSAEAVTLTTTVRGTAERLAGLVRQFRRAGAEQGPA